MWSCGPIHSHDLVNEIKKSNEKSCIFILNDFILVHRGSGVLFI